MSGPFKMKYTNGKNADTTAFPFKAQPPQPGDSPNKFDWSRAAKGAAIGGTAGLGIMGVGAIPGAVYGGLAGGLGGKSEGEEKYASEIEQAGLQRGFWGKLGFGGRRARERKAMIARLDEKAREGVDVERIKSRTVGSTDPMSGFIT